jgi:lysophospholipase L1-like esterase
MKTKQFALLSLAVLMVGSAGAQEFICAPAAHGAAKALTADTRFDAATSKTAGFDLVAAPAIAKGTCSSDKPFFFSVAATDGNYRVTLDLGGPEASVTTVRAESRRLYVQELKLAAKAQKTVVFNVNVRTDVIAGQTAPDGTPLKVKLKPREIGALDWDDKLTLEFNGEHPSVRSIKVERVDDVPTVYLAGDSTMVDQDKEPWAAWGQMLPEFFGPKVSIANNAESGETIKSFVGERRLAKVESVWRKGDYILIQFAHNDQKKGNGFVPIPEYKEIMERYIADARAKGVTPILVTAMNRRNFDADGKIEMTLGEYPQATRDVAAQEHLGLIDLNAMSKTLFEAMGDAGTLHAFVHYPANTFPDQPQELKDDTHFNSYGAYELARAIVQSIRDQHLPLEQYLRPGIAAFDPAKPLPFAEWKLPASPFVSTTTPYGR